MKITKEVELVPNLSVSKNIRSDLSAQIEKYWVGRKTSNIGIQYLDLVDGIVQVKPSYFCERTDILLFQCQDVCNIFAEADGSLSLETYDGVGLSEIERSELLDRADDLFLDNETYVIHERDFLRSKPWLTVDGLTPEQAVAVLRHWNTEKE